MPSSRSWSAACGLGGGDVAAAVLDGVPRPGGPLPLPLLQERPAAAQDRVEVGHWGGNLIMGPANRTAIATLVERFSRTVILVHLPAGKTSLAARDALLGAFTALPPGARGSLTWTGAPRRPTTPA